MKRLAWFVGGVFLLSIVGNVLLWLDVPLARPMFQRMWNVITPVLDRLTGIR